MLTQVGIRTTLRSSPTNQFFPKLTPGQQRASSSSAGRRARPLGSLNALLRTWSADGAGTFNAGRYSNPKLDALIDALRVEPDLRGAARWSADALRIVHDDLPLVPLYRRTLDLGDDSARCSVVQWPNDIARAALAVAASEPFAFYFATLRMTISTLLFPDRRSTSAPARASSSAAHLPSAA